MNDASQFQREASDGASLGNGPAKERRSAADSERPNPLDPMFRALAELQAYAALYLQTRADRVKLTLRKAAFAAALLLAAALSAACGLAVAVSLLLWGVAHGIAVLCGDRLWAGELITGALVIAAVAGGSYFGVRWVTNSSLRSLAGKYAERRQALRGRFGRDLPRDRTKGAGRV